MTISTPLKPIAVFLMLAFTMTLGSEVVPAGASGKRDAVAGRTQTVCRDRVSLRHAPGGVPIGYLYRGDRVIVVLYARRHRWAYVISARGYAWLLTRGLCRR